MKGSRLFWGQHRGASALYTETIAVLAKTLGRGSNMDVLRGLPSCHVNPLHHGLELLHGSTLIEVNDAVLNHFLHAGHPLHAVRELVCQQLNLILVELPVGKKEASTG